LSSASCQRPLVSVIDITYVDVEHGRRDAHSLPLSAIMMFESPILTSACPTLSPGAPF
jgi:hypothetical protein